jgi:DNA replication protein DnaC
MSRERKTTGLDRSRALLERLGWGFTSDRLVELIEQGVRDELTLGEFLELLAESETAFREEKRVKSWLKQSRLPIGRTFESFDFLFNRSIDREKIAMLATCEFIRRKETVLLLGPPGTGKTHLAAALGVKAVQNGFSTIFIEADDLIEGMRRIKEPPASNIRRPRYLGAQLLIIDELGFQALDRRDAHRLFQIVNHRYERSSTIITSNKSITEWPTMLAGDEALAAAILDRLLHHCLAIQTDGASYRLRHIEQQLRLQPNGAGATNGASSG